MTHMRDKLKQYQREHIAVTIVIPSLGPTRCRIVEVGFDFVEIELMPDTDTPLHSCRMTLNMWFIVSVAAHQSALASDDEDCADKFTGWVDHKTGKPKPIVSDFD